MTLPSNSAAVFAVIAMSPFLVVAEEARTASSNEPAFSASRPGNTESPIAVPKGYFQVESGIVSYTNDKIDDVRYSSLGLAQTAFRYGIAEGTDLQLIVQPYSRVTSRGAGNDTTYQGFGGVTLRVLHTFMGADGSNPAFGLIGFVTPPIVSKQLRVSGSASDRVEGGIIATGSTNLTDKMNITLTLGDAARRRNDSYVGDIFGGANLGYAVTERFGAYVELFSDHTKYSQTQTTADLGMTYLINPVTQFDAGVNIGVNHATADANFFLGLSHRF